MANEIVPAGPNQVTGHEQRRPATVVRLITATEPHRPVDDTSYSGELDRRHRIHGRRVPGPDEGQAYEDSWTDSPSAQSAGYGDDWRSCIEPPAEDWSWAGDTIETDAGRPSLVFAWLCSLLLGPLFAVVAVVGLIDPRAAQLVVIGALLVGIGASVVFLALVNDRNDESPRHAIATTYPPDLSSGRAEDGRQGRPQVARSGLVFLEHPHSSPPQGLRQPRSATAQRTPLVPRESHATPAETPGQRGGQ